MKRKKRASGGNTKAGLKLVQDGTPFVDSAWTARQAHSRVLLGPQSDQIAAEITLTMADSEIPVADEVSIDWKVKHTEFVLDEKYVVTDRHPDSRTDMFFRLDEIEVFATALYFAVQTAKKQGYLPELSLIPPAKRASA